MQTGVTDGGAARLTKALPELKIVRGVDLAKLAAQFPEREKKKLPTLKLKWFPVTSRAEAPRRSENGINTQVYFKNASKKKVKLFWISYGGGALKQYAELEPGASRQQNSYSRNAWLITDLNDQPLGYFVCEEDEALAIIPAAS